MVSFENDYGRGAHPDVLAALSRTNGESHPGYGSDRLCADAEKKIAQACGDPRARVVFLSGGTQTNALIIGALLHDWEGAAAPETGHIAVHEAGAVEKTGHKVLTLPANDGKLDAGTLSVFLRDFYGDANHEHMVFPGMVCISFPTETGSLYTKAELTALSKVCRAYSLPLYIDGARMICGLAASPDLTLPEIASLCDVFYIGGTKSGTLLGEAVVFPRGNLPPHFTTVVKQRGALLAKGWVLGAQFDALFTNGLYEKIGRHTIEAAEKMKGILRRHGCTFAGDSPTNQQFVVMDDARLAVFSKKIAYSFWEKRDGDRTVIRLVTDWSTSDADLAALDEALGEALAR